jgi:tripartite-type tricarboxylate transporter receptor subunit TctC
MRMEGDAMAEPTRRALSAGLFAAPFLARAAAAQAWPSRPIRLVVPYPPGGGADTTARLIAEPMGAALGQPVVVENRGGAGGTIGAAEVARAPHDGHTLLLDAGAHVVNPFVMRTLPFDYHTAFAPITQLTVLPQIMLVKTALPARTIAEFIALAKARPGELTYGSSGNATSSHLAAARFAQAAGISLVDVPYRGGGPAVQDLVAGNIDMHMGTVSSSLALAQAGRIRALGVTTKQRLAQLPDVPTIAESGFPGFELNEWNGLYAPSGTPEDVLDRIHAAAVGALAQPAVRARLESLGALAVGSSRAEFAAFLSNLRETMKALVAEANITVE